MPAAWDSQVGSYFEMSSWEWVVLTLSLEITPCRCMEMVRQLDSLRFSSQRQGLGISYRLKNREKMRVNSTNPRLKSTFFHGPVGYFCQRGDPTVKQRKGQGLISWKWNHSVISCCATDLFVCSSTELKQTALKLEKRLLLKIHSGVDDSSPKSGLREAGLLLWAPGLWLTHMWAGPLCHLYHLALKLCICKQNFQLLWLYNLV